MRRSAKSSAAKLGFAVLASLAVVLLVANISAAGSTTKVVAKEVDSAALGKTVLANTHGRTLYTLSAERSGRFICTASCLSNWHPLLVAANAKPTGPVRLGTIERPEGRTQVTFKGRPLYAFAGDTALGTANGEGIKDVGTWHAAVLANSPEPPAQPGPEPEYPY
jgi:predicted lipoprotein with Yx(FWY)xxD motif